MFKQVNTKGASLMGYKHIVSNYSIPYEWKKTTHNPQIYKQVIKSNILIEMYWDCNIWKKIKHFSDLLYTPH